MTIQPGQEGRGREEGQVGTRGVGRRAPRLRIINVINVEINQELRNGSR